MLLIFSNRCTSGWCIDAELAITKNVVFSNKTISSAPQIPQKVSRLAWSALIFGIRQWIIFAHAYTFLLNKLFHM